MKLTTKSKFAVTAVIDIAMCSKDSNLPISLLSISQRHSISLTYLEQLFGKLRKNGIVKSYKGPNGGYLLALDCSVITISSIIKAVEDDIDARACHGSESCHNNQKCLTHDLWEDLTVYMYSYLDNVTVSNVLEKHLLKPIKFSNL
jgi:Rrf2 family iron-sulfur cluster assembly transcriptional regulator